jgi:hypothetical protein
MAGDRREVQDVLHRRWSVLSLEDEEPTWVMTPGDATDLGQGPALWWLFVPILLLSASTLAFYKLRSLIVKRLTSLQKAVSVS